MEEVKFSDLTWLGWRAFAEAFAAGDAQAAALAARDHPKLGQARLPTGATAMTMAVAQGPHFVEALAPLCDCLGGDRDGCAPLMWAARLGSLDSVRLLLPKSDPLALDHGGMGALAWAMGSPDCVAALLKVSDLGQKDASGWSLLDSALARGDVSSLAALCAEAAERDYDWDAQTWASAREHAKRRGSHLEAAIEAFAKAAQERKALGEHAKKAPSAKRKSL